jgi:hypothetical protein
VSEPEELSALWQLARTRERQHIVAALVLGLSHWPRVLEIIAISDEADDACAQLSAEFGWDQIQSNTMLDVQFRRLVGSSRSWLEAELSELHARTTDLERIVAEDPERAMRAPTPTVVMITVDEVMPLLLADVPSFEPVWALVRGEQENCDDQIYYPDATYLAPHLVGLLERGDTTDVAAAFELIERLIRDGDDEVQELTITYLQGVQNCALRSALVTLEGFEPFLGTESGRWWRGLNAVWSRALPPPVRPID